MLPAAVTELLPPRAGAGKSNQVQSNQVLRSLAKLFTMPEKVVQNVLDSDKPTLVDPSPVPVRHVHLALALALGRVSIHGFGDVFKVLAAARAAYGSDAAATTAILKIVSVFRCRALKTLLAAFMAMQSGDAGPSWPPRPLPQTAFIGPLALRGCGGPKIAQSILVAIMRGKKVEIEGIISFFKQAPLNAAATEEARKFGTSEAWLAQMDAMLSRGPLPTLDKLAPVGVRALDVAAGKGTANSVVLVAEALVDSAKALCVRAGRTYTGPSAEEREAAAAQGAAITAKLLAVSQDNKPIKCAGLTCSTLSACRRAARCCRVATQGLHVVSRAVCSQRRAPWAT